MESESRAQKFEQAVEHVRHWGTPDVALRAVGIRPETATADERSRLAEAEREAVDEAIGMIRKAAKTDTVAERWLRSRGVSVEG